MFTLHQAESRIIAHMSLNYIDRVIGGAVVDHEVLKIVNCLP